MIAVDRTVPFGERLRRAVRVRSASANHPQTPTCADCALSCHLGGVRPRPAPSTSRAEEGPATPATWSTTPRRRPRSGAASTGAFTHPRLSATPTDEHCFGCHSRSGRISLHAAGLREARPGERVVRTLADGRALAATTGDLHTAAGFLCVDCHPSWEVMGDGAPWPTARTSSTCGARTVTGWPPRTAVAAVPLERLDAETRRLAARLGLATPARPFVRYGERGFAFPNVRVESDRVLVTLKGNRRMAEARPPGGGLRPRRGPRPGGLRGVSRRLGPPVHRLPHRLGPERNARRPPGRSRETRRVARDARRGPLRPPHPGRTARRRRQGGPLRGVRPGHDPDDRADPREPVRFQRLLAPLTAHTTQRAARTCDDCHRSPLALGYGRGHLGVVPGTGGAAGLAFRAGAAAARGRSAGGRLRSASRSPADWALPLDRTRVRSTRRSGRILRVGACLACHAPETPVMRAAVADFAATDARRTKRCRVPPGP